MVSRVDVTLQGDSQFPIHATVFAATVSAQARAPQPLPATSTTISPASVARLSAVGVPLLGRDTLTVGVDKPTAATTGTLPNFASVKATVVGDVTLSTPGQVYENKDVFGKITVTASGVTIRNCRVRGGVSGSALIQCTASSGWATPLLVEDCYLYPDTAYWGWMGITGSAVTIRRCDISHCQDAIEIKQDGRTSTSFPWLTRVIIEQNYLHDMAWWSASAAGIIHPSDTETHNDLIQHFGGGGTIIRGNLLDAKYARNYGHWYVTGSTTVEPYTTVALHSLGDSLNGPNQNIPNRGSGNESTGRYNYDDIACLQIGDEQGTTYDMTFTKNWCYGGGYGINGGGNAFRSGSSLGTFTYNKFSRDQGTQGGGGNNTYTMALGPWSGNVTVPLTGTGSNTYESDGANITVRY